MQKTIMLSVLVLAFSVQTLKATTPVNLPQSLGETTLILIKGAENHPLHLSVIKGDLETVQKLIALGADVNQKWNGMTPAMYAARHNRVEILKVLIAKGANLKDRCNKRHNAAYYAKISGATEAENLIAQTLAK
tara:strand:- start:7157 stop:7558 length:402 start_codon:yes stop_codon:yes gene_type:complete